MTDGKRKRRGFRLPIFAGDKNHDKNVSSDIVSTGPETGLEDTTGRVQLSDSNGLSEANMDGNARPVLTNSAGQPTASFDDHADREEAQATSLDLLSFSETEIERGVDEKTFNEKPIDYPIGVSYRAMYVVNLREGASRASKCKGTTQIGSLYRIVETRAAMGVVFGHVDTGLWVILSEGQKNYFERL